MKKTFILLFSIFISIISSNAQTYQWAKNIGGTLADGGNSVTIDNNGFVYTTGYFQGTVDFDPGLGTSNLTSVGSFDIFISKLDAAGNFLWAINIGGINYDYITSVAVDSSGNVYTTGRFQGTIDFDPGAGTSNLTNIGSWDIFILKLDSAGSFLWAKTMGGIDSDYCNSIAVDALGNVYNLGYFEGTPDFDPGVGSSNLTSAGGSDIFISKLDAAGNFLWVKGMGGTGSDYGTSIAVDAAGYIYTTGYFKGTVDFDPGVGTSNLTSAGSEDIFISKLDTVGNFLWAKRMGSTSIDNSHSIAVDGSGNVYSTGNFQGTVDFDPGTGSSNLTSAGVSDIFISKLDSTGNFLLAKSMGGTGGDLGISIALDGSGNMCTTGYFQVTADFDPGTGTSNLTSAGSWDIFISKLDAAGNFLWAKGMGGTGGDYGNSIALDGSGHMYTTGRFVGTVDFDPGTGTSNLTSDGGEDIFILKLDATNVGILENSFGNTLTVYPNPTNGAMSIDLGASYDDVTVIITNQLGQDVLRKSYSGSNLLQLGIPGEAGLYFIEVNSGDKKAIIKVLKE